MIHTTRPTTAGSSISVQPALSSISPHPGANRSHAERRGQGRGRGSSDGGVQ
jgi:hypothetical protein